MRDIFDYYFRMALLRAKPQDCPSSRALQKFLIVIYLLLSIINALALYDVWGAAALSVLDVSLLYVFVLFLLHTKRERTHQTFNAFLGVGILIGLMHTICSYMFILDQDPRAISGLGRTFFYIVFIWGVLGYGNIVRHSAEVNLATGISISLGYTLLNAMMLLSISEMFGV